MKSKQLKEKRAEKLTAQETMINARNAKPTEERNFSTDEQEAFNRLTNEIDDLDAQIRNAENEEKAELRIAAAKGVAVDPIVEENKPQERFSVSEAINALIDNRGLNARQKEVREEAMKELRNSGIDLPEGNVVAIPSSMMRAQTVGGNSGEKGGKLVASIPQMQKPLQPTLRVEALGADVLEGLVGDVPLPTNDAFTFGFVGETETVTATDVNIDGPILKPKRAAGVVDISHKLLKQSGFSVDTYIMDQINNAIDVAITRAALNGAGGNAPTGLYTLITSNVQSGPAAAPEHADLVGLRTLIQSANSTEDTLAYVMDPEMLGKLETTKVDAGSGVFVAQNNKVSGQAYLATTLADTLDAGASHPIIFGDWSQLKVGRWGGVSFIVDPYTKASSGKVRIVFNVYVDVAVANEKAFAIRKNFTV